MTTAMDLADFVLKLASANDVDSALMMSLETVRDAVGADCGGAMMVVKRQVGLAVSDGERAERADQLQLELGTGPCLEAIEDAVTFGVDDTLTEPRWEPWCRKVADLGIRSVLSVRLATLDGTLGSFNLYFDEPGAIDKQRLSVAKALMPHASAAIAALKTEEGLRDAMQGRHVIGLAQGILMERFKIDEDAAFSVLRRYSQDLNLKLRNVAQDFVATRTLPSLDQQARVKSSDPAGE